MSIVVKGANMPNNCGTCPLRLAWCRQRLYMITRPDRCPLESVRKGKWVKLYAGNYKCSECGAWLGNDDNSMVEDFKFCPNCGADMRGEEE